MSAEEPDKVKPAPRKKRAPSSAAKRKAVPDSSARPPASSAAPLLMQQPPSYVVGVKVMPHEDVAMDIDSGAPVGDGREPKAEPPEVMRGFALAMLPVDPARAWTGISDVVSRAELADHATQLLLERKAHQSAEAVLKRAQVEAEAIMKRARQQARTLGDTQLKLWQEAFDARQEELSESLGQAVSVVVHAVLDTVLNSDADLPVQVSLELAMRVLNNELRSSVLCHPLDLPLVQAQTGRLGTSTSSVDTSLPRGQVVFSGPEGEVRVDGQRVIDKLLLDLRHVLSSKVNASPS